MPKKRRVKKHRRQVEVVEAPLVAVHANGASRPMSASAIIQTIKDLEKCRAFVKQSMNQDLQREIKRREVLKMPALNEAERMKLEVDYGTIPGVEKPFLKQPGAEKILFWLHCFPHYHKQANELGDGHLEEIAYVEILSKADRLQIFEGPDASCSTMESNYRFRWVKRTGDEKDPFPDDEEAKSLRRQGRGAWRKIERWAHGKKTGIMDWVWFDRVDNPNIHDTRNTVRQQGQKRALVKACRNMGCFSEIFTTDPSEWAVSLEEETGDPKTDKDFTETGNRVVNDQGFAPSGEPVTWAARQQQARDKAGEVAERLREGLKPTMSDREIKTWENLGARQDPGAAEAPAIQARECQIVLLYQGRFIATGHRLGDKRMIDFLQAVQCKTTKRERDSREWDSIDSLYLDDFQALCFELKIKVKTTFE